MKVGSVLECNGNIYLVKEIHECGRVVANLCGRDRQELFVVPGMNIYINPSNLDEYKVIGEAEVA